MENNTLRTVLCVWFSGFFGLGAVGHGLRFALGLPVTIGTFSVPLAVSAVAALILALLSAGLLYLACNKGSCCKTP